AKPPKGGGAELRGLRRPVVVMSARPPATRQASEFLAAVSLLGSSTTAVRQDRTPSRERDKGKPGESRGRKAPRLPHAVACHASRAAEPLRRGLCCSYTSCRAVWRCSKT